MAIDYWPQKDGVISLNPVVGFFMTGDTSVVNGLGVQCYTSDTAGQVTIMLATAKQGWGIALATQATAGKTVPVCTRGFVKAIAGGTYTRNLAVAFDSAGKVVALADQAVNESGSSTYTIYYSAKIGRAMRSGTQSGDEILIYLNP